jgi:CelD/BcsL family acetyltransferase involved in cellulose biosynthesis
VHTPFQSIDWNSLYWKYLAPSDWTLQVFLLSDREGILRGAAPMYLEPGSSIRPAALKNIASVIGDYGDLLIEPGYEDAVCKALIARIFSQKSAWNTLDIGKLQPSSPLLSALEGTEVASGNIKLKEDSPTYRIALPESFDAFLAGLDSKFRANVRRRKKRLMADHSVIFKSVECKDELHRVVEGFIRHQKARFAEQYKYGFFKNQDREIFFREASEKFLEKGWLDLHYMTIDDNLGAAQFSLQFGAVRYNYQIVMDPAYRVHSPGTLLMMSSIEASIDQGIKVYDLLSGEMDYKHHLRAEPVARYSWHWTRRPITTWANHKFGEIREDLESKIWLRRWAFNRRNMTTQ